MILANVPTQGKSFSMEAKKDYSFIVSGEENLEAKKITIIDQKRGYSNAIYLIIDFPVFISDYYISLQPKNGFCRLKTRKLIWAKI